MPCYICAVKFLHFIISLFLKRDLYLKKLKSCKFSELFIRK